MFELPDRGQRGGVLETERQPAATSRSLLQYLEERKHFSGGVPAVPENMGRQHHDQHERVPDMVQQQRRGAHVGSHLKYMFHGLLSYFTVPNEKNKDLYQLFKNNIVGGPNILFHRFHERDVTSIPPRVYEEPNICKKIIGYDANALYLCRIMQEMPTDILYAGRVRTTSGETLPNVMSGWRLNGWNGKPSRADTISNNRATTRRWHLEGRDYHWMATSRRPTWCTSSRDGIGMDMIVI